jgi:hypothetical protein
VVGGGGVTTADIEWALIKPQRSKFNFLKCIVVPNVSWGMVNHECDLLALTKSDVAHEIEIKISKSDLKADLKKRHTHDGGTLIKYLWFAGPETLEDVFVRDAPDRAGIILVYEDYADRPGMCYRIARHPKPNTMARKWTLEDRARLARLGAMRYWTRWKHSPAHGGKEVYSEDDHEEDSD